MILFAVPAGIATANRSPQARSRFQHLSTGRLVASEITHGLNRLCTRLKRAVRWLKEPRRGRDDGDPPSVDDWASEHGLIPARVSR